MSALGQWFGRSMGAWFGALEQPAPVVTQQPGGSRGRVGGGRIRRPVRSVQPDWQREHENDAVLIAAGII